MHKVRELWAKSTIDSMQNIQIPDRDNNIVFQSDRVQLNEEILRMWQQQLVMLHKKAEATWRLT